MSFFIRSGKLTANTFRTYSRVNKTTRVHQQSFVRGFKSTSIKMVVHNINSKVDFDNAIKDNDVVILDAFATWCGPCKVIAPQVVKFSEEYPNAHFVKIDVDEVPDVAQELGIRAMPTFVIFKGGEKVKEVVGANPQALKSAIAAHTVAVEAKQ